VNGVGGRGLAVVGAGISGLHMSRVLQGAGFCPTIFEKADEVGGTWRENTYPGLVCDVPAPVYTYTILAKPDLRDYELGDPPQRVGAPAGVAAGGGA
jgi:cation diffusion facilitator CzcD-associated flavoprotein CzcO